MTRVVQKGIVIVVVIERLVVHRLRLLVPLDRVPVHDGALALRRLLGQQSHQNVLALALDISNSLDSLLWTRALGLVVDEEKRRLLEVVSSRASGRRWRSRCTRAWREMSAPSLCCLTEWPRLLHLRAI